MFANTPRCSWTIDMVGPEPLECPKLAKNYFFVLPNEHSHFFDFEETKPHYQYPPNFYLSKEISERYSWLSIQSEG